MKLLRSSLAVLLTACIVFATVIPAFATTDANSKPETTAFYGDVDDDGDVDMQDVLMLEKYIADSKTKINEENADVNADWRVNNDDVKMLKDYLLGNIDSLTPDLVTISFDTKGGNEIEPMEIGRGYSVVKELPTPAKENNIFVGWKKSDGSDFYKEDAVTENITLVAQYEAIESQEDLIIDSYSETDCSTTVKFTVKGDFNSAVEVKANVTLVPKDGFDPVAIKVTKTDNGTFDVGSVTSFTPGGSYELTLGDGLTFAGKDENIRKVNFVIKKEEGDQLRYNDKVKFIQDTVDMKYFVNGGEELDVLESALLNNKESNDDITGTFNMPDDGLSDGELSDGGLVVGDIVCIFENIDPRNRDYTDDEKLEQYQDDSIAYVRITAVNGDIYSFESLSDEDANEVLMMPDSIPFSVEALPTAKEGTVLKSAYDKDARKKLGFKEEPEFNTGDFLIFYTGEFDEEKDSSEVAYAQVLNMNDDTVSYKIVTKDYIDSFMGMFVKQDVKSDELLENVDEEKLLSGIAKQVEESGFAEESAGYMLQSAMENEEVIDAMKKNGMTKKEIDYYATASDIFAQPTGARRTTLGLDGLTVQPTLIKSNQFKNGVGVRVEVHVILSLETRIGATASALKIDLFASFEQEVAVGMDVNIEDTWKWYLFVPVLEELSCYTSIDIQSYSAVSVGATLYSVQEKSMKKWKVFSDKLKSDPYIYGMMKSLDNLALKAKKLAKGTQALEDVLDQIENIENSLPVFVVDGKEYSFNQIRESLGAENVATAFAENFGAETDKEAKVGMQRLIDRYSELLENESEWVELVNWKLFDRDFNIKVVAINLTVRIMIRGNINLSIGADIEYKVGKRYNFWVHVVSRKSGSNEMDLIDEKFGFQLYVMGTLGLRFGIKAEINLGIISTKLGSIGASVEFGPYIRIWGYFCYVYTRNRPANTNSWKADEEMQGAIYLEAGLYVTVRFKAQILDGTFKYEPTLYDKEIPKLKKGDNPVNVYDFATTPEEEKIRIVDSDNYSANGITMDLSQNFRRMKTINLQTGEQGQGVYSPDNFNFTTSSRKFKVDANGVVSVSPSSDDRYLEGSVKITWKAGKLAFTKYDMSITVPVYWTNLTEDEMNQKFTASVAVGNSTDGYNVIWSNRYTRFETFNLPTKEKVLDLIKYNSYESDSMNLKYSKVDGYKGESTNLKISNDTTYYFDVTKRVYTVNVSGIQDTDGNKSDRTYKAFYGETFDLRELSSTGTDNTTKKIYTIFSNLTKSDDEDTVFELKTTVDSDFSKTYGTTANLKANYADNSATATYTFVGINAPETTVKFKKGEIPYFDGLDSYIEGYGGQYARRVDISPAVGKVEHSVKYLVTCKISLPIPKHTITFDTKGGSVISPQVNYEGSELLPPTNPKRTGYDFKGWYTDSACTTMFSFDTLMPKEDITIYAKWEPRKFNVFYYNVDGDIVSLVRPKAVYYNSTYGEAPTLASRITQKHIGWYTERTGGTEVTSKTLVRTLSDVNLYARWENKASIPKDAVELNSNYTNFTYDSEPHCVYLNYKSGPTDNYQIFYKSGSSDWSNTIPINAGTYDVQIRREACEDYLPFSMSFSNALNIKKKDIKLGSLSAKSIGNTVVVKRPANYRGSGKITYQLSSSYTSPTGVFNDVPSGSYKCKISIGEDVNYNYTNVTSLTTDVSVSGVQAYTIKFKVVNGTGSGAGTDGEVYGLIDYTNGTNSGWVKMDSSANDFENGDIRTYTIKSGVNPFLIKGIRLKAKVGADHWQCNYVDVIATNDVNTYTTKVNFNNRWFEKTEETGTYSCSFKRTITLDGSMSGTQTVNLSNPQSRSFSISGKIKDQYNSSFYNPLTVSSYPTFKVTANNSTLLNYIQYTDVTAFEIDVEGLKQYVKENGTGSFFYTATYQFPSESVSGTRSYTKNIWIDTSGIKKSTGVAATGANKDDYTLSVDSGMFADVGDEILVPVRISGTNPLWGVMAQVSYSTEQLELVDVDGEGIFDADKFAVQKDLSQSTVKFIATNDEIKNVKADGIIATLKFNVKRTSEGTGLGISPIVLQTAAVEVKKEDTSKVTTTTTPTAKTLKKGTNIAAADKLIQKTKSDKDIAGSVFRTLQTQSKKIGKTSIQIKWNKVKGAKKYIVYGNKCGSTYKKLKSVSAKTTTFTHKKLKKGTYYKYIVVAVDSKSKIISASKTAHIATKGGKVGNYKTIQTAAKNNKVTLKKGKTFKLKTKTVAESKKLKVKNHRGIKYEITNSKVLKVSSKGVVTAKQKGTCYIYAYAQNNICKKIKVKVK